MSPKPSNQAPAILVLGPGGLEVARRVGEALPGARLHGLAGRVEGADEPFDSFADQARALQVSSRTLVENLAVLFPAGTGADKVKTRAKPEIWQDWKKFEAGARQLGRETAKLAEVAKSGDMKAFAAQYKAVSKACAACHKPFRASKKRKKRK